MTQKNPSPSYCTPTSTTTATLVVAAAQFYALTPPLMDASFTIYR